MSRRLQHHEYAKENFAVVSTSQQNAVSELNNDAFPRHMQTALMEQGGHLLSEMEYYSGSELD